MRTTTEERVEQVVTKPEVFCDLCGKQTSILQSIKGAVQRWKRGDDVCYQVTGGMLRKNGGKKALDKVAKHLVEMGYERHIVRSVRAPREAR